MKVWMSQLLPTVAECAGADVVDEVLPVVNAFVDVLSVTLSEGTDVGIVGLGCFNVEGNTIVFSPSRRLLKRLQGR